MDTDEMKTMKEDAVVSEPLEGEVIGQEEIPPSTVKDWVARHQEREAKRDEIRQRVRGAASKKEYFRPAKPKPTIQDETRKVVAVYARVSTTNENQVSSIENQTLYYEKKIADNPLWEMQEIYSDEGKSGTSLRHRDAFRRMMADAEQQKMDLILCASVSRFARNMSDCLEQVAALKTMHPQKPIGVYFETENIYTLDPNSDQSFHIHAMLADWESGNKSRRMILSYDQRILTGQYPVSDLLGFRHTKDGDLIIEPEEAKTVRFMFFARLAGYTYDEIAEVLTRKKRSTLRGRTEWTGSMVKSIMSNERTWGDLEARKTIVIDYKKGIVIRNNGQRDSAYVPGHHVGIVTPEIAKAAKVIAASSRRIDGGVHDIGVITDGTLKGFLSLCPGYGGMDAASMMTVSLRTYEQEELDALVERDVKLRGQEPNEVMSMALTGYQVPPGVFFINRSTPSLTITRKGFKFNKASGERLGMCEFVDVLYHPVLQTLVVRASEEEYPNSIRWTNDAGKIIPLIPAKALSAGIYEIQRWNEEYEYRFRGYCKKRGKTTFLMFSLDEPQILLGKQQRKAKEAEDHYIEYQEDAEPRSVGMGGYTYPDSWGESFVGMAYALRSSRDSVIASISESDLLDHRAMVVNPMIGEIPSQEEILKELDQLLQAM